MKGIEIARRFFEQEVKLMLERDFSDYMPYIAVGLVGHGSECFGYDDEISVDHDYGEDCIIWVTDEVFDKIGFSLQRAYSRLKNGSSAKKSAEGSFYRGVVSVGDFYMEYTGRRGAPETINDWMYTPSSYFAEAVNGEVFYDGNGLFTSIRNTILTGMPEEVRLKRISRHAIFAGQSGQYNFSRCLAHGEKGAAGIALSEFVQNAAEVIFLLNRRYMPYYKWMFRAMRELSLLSDMAEPLEFLLSEPNVGDGGGIKAEIIEDIAAAISKEMANQGLISDNSTSLEAHAFEIAKKIKNPDIRGEHIMG